MSYSKQTAASWDERKPLAVVLVDVAKAFDTVSHDHLLAVLVKSTSFV